MRTLIVSEEFILKYRELVHRYADHDRNCGMHPQNLMSLNDFCDCGYASKIRELQRLQSNIKILGDEQGK